KAEISWLLTWLGQADAAEGDVPAEPSSRQHGTMQWLTVRPAAADIQTLLGNSTLPEGGKNETPSIVHSVPADTTSATGMPLAQVPLAKDDDEFQEFDTVAPTVPPIVWSPLPTATATPVMTKQEQATAPGLSGENPAATPAEAPAKALPSVVEDKGEVVWTADLIIAAQTSSEQSVQHQAIAPTDGSPAPPHEAGAATNQADTSGFQQEFSSRPDTGTKDENTESAKQESIPAAMVVSTPRKDSDNTSVEHVASPPGATPAITPATVTAAAHMASVSTPSETSAPAAPQLAEPPQTLRPTQIATLQVDVPSVARVDGAAPMRLIVSQRGDQVNVRLRSWDSGNAPLSSEQMQPLLDSLSSQGLVNERRPIERISESAHVLGETPAERLPTLNESASANNEQQTFQNAHDRQQQNQERQQQQQAFFLRKQLKNTQVEEFTLPAWVEGNTVRY
ncbi:MAG TPA: hypothetical protein VFQ91_18675, partial [Bryobacteraceae bacterium]|nr:hypothetical protein [Bryobacteraceae bacterium]